MTKSSLPRLLVCLSFSLLGLVLTHSPLGAQDPYFGAGSDRSMSISSSPVSRDPAWPDDPSAEKIINGDGLISNHLEVIRFLEQSSLGFTSEQVDSVLDLGIEGWIDDQIDRPTEYILPRLQHIHTLVIDSLLASGTDSSDIDWRPSYKYFNYAWWDVNMKNDDLLRHGVATALSEIFVISRRSAFEKYGFGLASYYDLLLDAAFGNFEDFLYDMTLHPMMGWYLTFVNNPKTDTVNNIFPDENYAREIMQLFSIGLFELNLDGSLELDMDGNEIETYDNDDIAEFAKVFTGLSYGTLWYRSNKQLQFGLDLKHADMTVPMIMYEDEHEPG